MDTTTLDPASQKQLQDAVRLLADAGKPGEGMQEARQARGGYRLLYVASQGCGDSIHSFDNMQAAASRHNLSIGYVQGDATPVSQWRGGQPIGGRIGGFYDEDNASRRRAERSGISIFETQVYLVGPNNRVLGSFNSRDRDFPEQIGRSIQSATQQRGNRLF